MDLSGWPKGMRAPTPARNCVSTASTGCASPRSPANTSAGQLADLELRHRRRARYENRIRIAKDTGLRNLPLKAFAQNQIWCAIVALTTHEARRWEPKRLRLRLFTIPTVLARTGRRTWLRLGDRAPWAHLAAQAVTTLRARAAPS